MQMNIANQIKKLRDKYNISQEELSEKIFVSRQTISNWENNKNYPDIKSLLLMCEVFDVSLDYLVKGDVEEMKKIIKSEDVKKLKKYLDVIVIEWVVFLICSGIIISIIEDKGQLTKGKIFFIIAGILFYVIMLITLYKVEILRKKHNIETYKEIVKFLEEK